MNTAKKTKEENIETKDSEQNTENAAPIPAWKTKKKLREKLLRAMRTKTYTDTIKQIIRTQIKKKD